MSDESLTVVGRIGKAHGLKGDLLVHPESQGSDVLLQVDALTVEQGGKRRRLKVRSSKVHSGTILLAFEGFPDRTAAEKLTGATVLLAASELPEPDEGEFYRHALIGLAVVSPSGEDLGRVVDLESSPMLEWLVVEGPKGRALVPFTEPMTRVDLAAGKVTVDAPEGLFELGDGSAGKRDEADREEPDDSKS